MKAVVYRGRDDLRLEDVPVPEVGAGEMLRSISKSAFVSALQRLLPDITGADLVAGRAAGMVTVAVLTGLAPVDDLAPLADAVLPDIGALPGWLATMG